MRHSPLGGNVRMDLGSRRGTYSLRVGGVQHVPQGAVGWSEQRPHGAGPLLDVTVLPLLPTVAQEGPEQTGVGVLHQLHLHGKKQTGLTTFQV